MNDMDNEHRQSSSVALEEASEIISLNVGGQSFKFCARTLRTRYPDARLARFVCADHASRRMLCAAYLQAESVYFYERSSRLFECVYRLYVNGSGGSASSPSFCCRDACICESELRAELAYWELPVFGSSTGGANDELKRCRSCSTRSQSVQLALMQRKSSAFGHPRIVDRETPSLVSNSSVTRPIKETRLERIYRFCEGDGTPQSLLFITISISFVILSVVGLVLGSIQEFQVPYRVNGGNVTLIANDRSREGMNSGLEKSTTFHSIIWEPLPVFGYLETVCIIWFTGEYFLRFVVAPNRLQFASQLVNVVDLIAILPFYLEMVLALCGFDVTRLSEIKGAFLVVRIMRVLRVVRILKLGRYSSGMRTFALTLRSSARQLGMMGMVLFTGVVFFSTLLYFVEKDEPRTPFTSIPAAFWWAIVTMSTVGYGDLVPVTIMGKLIASGAILSGVLVLALPITIIVDNFMRVSGSFSTNPFTGTMVAYGDCDHQNTAEQGTLLTNGRPTTNKRKESINLI